jgi:hypothetical protein
MTACLSRRRFLTGAAAGVTGLSILTSAHVARGYPANERLNLAVVGMSGYGAYHGFAEAMHTYEQVRYAFSCDVDLRKVQRVYDFWSQRAREWSDSPDVNQRRAVTEHYGPLTENKPPLYRDFRRMLDEAGKQIDAVVVATPDHTHAVIAAAALRAGKPVLVEKPLTISAHEARALNQLAQRHRLPTQMNNGGAASPGFRRGVEILREGVIGTVQQVHVFFSRGGRNFQQPPRGVHPVPPKLDWNLWLAQVAWREYNPDWINRIAWRETSLGELGNFGPHSANMAFLALNVRQLWDAAEGHPPIRIQAECSEVNRLSYPRWEKIRWEVPARPGLPPVTFTWHHGYPPEYAPGSRNMLADLLREHGASEQDVQRLLPYAGCIILGSRGLLATNSHNTTVRLLPQERFEAIEQSRPLNTALSPGHYREWVQACRDGSETISHFGYAAPFAEFLCVGSIATRFPGERIEFDPTTGRILNHPAAEQFLQYPYRDGWTI